jgi:hypothetical protein
MTEYTALGGDMRDLTQRLDGAGVEIVKQLSGRVLRQAIKRTPVGKKYVSPYSEEEFAKLPANVQRDIGVLQARMGGTLRRGWTVQGLKKLNDGAEATVTNNVKYAIYVENGHRQHVGQFVPVLKRRLKNPVVRGQFMLRRAIEDVNKVAPNIVKAELDKAAGKR